MNRAAGKLRECGRTDARARLRQAKGHLTAADLMIGENTNVATSDAVLAGIAASDALCCFHLGQRSSDGDHVRATDLLHQVDSDAAKKLQRLLRMKTKAQYDFDVISASEARSAYRLASQLVALADAALLSSP